MKNYTHIPDGSFAESCYDQNSLSELEAALENGPDKTDMETWNISAAEWRVQVELALQAKLWDIQDARTDML